MRKIIHIDMDAFFASVEQRDHPELRGKPIAVGYDGVRGVVSTASYEARKYGVRSAMSMQIAKRICKDLIIVPGRYDRYKEVSLAIHSIFHDYTDLVEPISLDEAFLDVTHNKKDIPLNSASKMNYISPRRQVSPTTNYWLRSHLIFTNPMAYTSSALIKHSTLSHSYLWKTYGAWGQRPHKRCTKWASSTANNCDNAQKTISKPSSGK